MNISVWKVEENNGANNIKHILDLLLIEYERIFEDEIMNNEECIVYNDPQANCPMLVTNSTPIRIRLAQSSTSYWAQTIYQLSHELCHYAIRQIKNNKGFTLSWFEEIVCEAMSLYMLKWSAENWDKHSGLWGEFKSNIKNYLNDELNKTGTTGFQSCASIEMLGKYDAERDRESHINERNKVYYEIIKNPKLCRCFCDYERYVEKNNITIDFNAWERDDNNPMVRCLHKLQPCN